MYHFEEMCPPSFLKLNLASIPGDWVEFSWLVYGWQWSDNVFLSNTHSFLQSQHIQIFNDTAHKDDKSLAGESEKTLNHFHFSIFKLMGSILFLKLHTSLVWASFNFYTNESVSFLST